MTAATVEHLRVGLALLAVAGMLAYCFANRDFRRSLRDAFTSGFAPSEAPH